MYVSLIDAENNINNACDKLFKLILDADLNSSAFAALETAVAACDEGPREADLLKELGNNAFKQEQYTLAAQYYSAAIDICKDNKTYYANRAACHNKLQQYQDAVKDASTAINIFEYLEDGELSPVAAKDKGGVPVPVKAYLRRIEALQALGSFGDALSDCNKCTALCEHINISVPPEIDKIAHMLEQQSSDASVASLMHEEAWAVARQQQQQRQDQQHQQQQMRSSKGDQESVRNMSPSLNGNTTQPYGTCRVALESAFAAPGSCVDIDADNISSSSEDPENDDVVWLDPDDAGHKESAVSGSCDSKSKDINCDFKETHSRRPSRGDGYFHSDELSETCSSNNGRENVSSNDTSILGNFSGFDDSGVDDDGDGDGGYQSAAVAAGRNSAAFLWRSKYVGCLGADVDKRAQSRDYSRSVCHLMARGRLGALSQPAQAYAMLYVNGIESVSETDYFRGLNTWSSNRNGGRGGTDLHAVGARGDNPLAKPLVPVAVARAALASVPRDELEILWKTIAYIPGVTADINARVSSDLAVARDFLIRCANSTRVPMQGLAGSSQRVTAILSSANFVASELEYTAALLTDNPRVALGPLRELQTQLWSRYVSQVPFSAAVFNFFARAPHPDCIQFAEFGVERMLTRALVFFVTMLPGIHVIAHLVLRRMRAAAREAEETWTAPSPRSERVHHGAAASELVSAYIAEERIAETIDSQWLTVVRALSALRNAASTETGRENIYRAGAVRVVARLVHQLLQLEGAIMQGVHVLVDGDAAHPGMIDLRGLESYNDCDCGRFSAGETRVALMFAADAAFAAPAESWLSGIAVMLEAATGLLLNVLQSETARSQLIVSGATPATPALSVSASAGADASTAAAAAPDANAAPPSDDVLETLVMATAIALQVDSYTKHELQAFGDAIATSASPTDSTGAWTSAPRPFGSASVLPSGQRLVRRSATQNLLSMTEGLARDTQFKALVQRGWQPGITLISELQNTLRVAWDAADDASSEHSIAGPEFGFGVGFPSLVPTKSSEFQMMPTVPSVARAYLAASQSTRALEAAKEQLARERKKLNEATQSKGAKGSAAAKGGAKSGKGGKSAAAAQPDAAAVAELALKVDDAQRASEAARKTLDVANQAAHGRENSYAAMAAAPFADGAWCAYVRTHVERCGVKAHSSMGMSVGRQLNFAALASASEVLSSALTVLQELSRKKLASASLPAPVSNNSTNTEADATATSAAAPDRVAALALAAKEDNEDGEAKDQGDSLEVVACVALRALLCILNVSVLDRLTASKEATLHRDASGMATIISYMKLLRRSLDLLLDLAVSEGVHSAERIVAATPALPWALFALVAPPPSGLSPPVVQCSGLDITLMRLAVTLLTRLLAGSLAARDDMLARNGIGFMLGTGIAAVVAATLPDNSSAAPAGKEDNKTDALAD